MAARDFIKIDRNVTTTVATKMGLLLEYIESVRKSYELGKRVGSIMDHNNDGTNFTDLETMFSIPAGSGATVLALVNGAIQDNAAKALTERVG